MSKHISTKATLFASLVLFMGCQSTDKNSGTSAPEVTASLPADNGDFFQEISPDLGVDFKHSIGDEHLDNLVESVGGGAVFLDYDQDGFIDLYVSNGSYTEGLSKVKNRKGTRSTSCSGTGGTGPLKMSQQAQAWGTRGMAWG